jgi:class 3 adenylate cyclase
MSAGGGRDRTSELARSSVDAIEPAPPKGPRLLTPSSTGQRPFPRRIAIAFGVSAIVTLIGTTLSIEPLKGVAILVAILAACGLGAWAEQRLYHGLLGLPGLRRLLATLLVPVFLLVLSPVAALLGAPMAMMGDEGGTAVALLLGGLWAASMALGSAVMVCIDVVVSAVVKDFRSRVQLAVLSLIGMAVGTAVAVVAIGRLVAREIIADGKRGEISDTLALDLGDEVLRGEDVRRLLEMSETTDFISYGLLLSFGLIVLPSVLSACGKLADGVMERLNPLSQAIDEVTQGKLDLRVEEGGSRDFVRITQGFNRMVESLEQTLEDLDRRNRDLADLNRATSRFVPFQFLELLDKESLREIRRGDQIELDISVLFADIRGFTTMAEAMGPEATFGFINRYLGHMEAAIHREQGFINNVFGDGIMALFHVSADASVRASLGMLAALDEFNDILVSEGTDPVHIGVGLNSGPLMLGTVGGQDRLSCTVIGDPANTAARTEGMTKLYGASLLITEGTYDRLADVSLYEMRQIDRVQAKGKATSMSIYEVLDGEPRERKAQKLAGRQAFADALALYREGDFAAAGRGFADLVKRAPLDTSATLYVRRCKERLALGQVNWDGVTRLTEK